MQTPAAPSRTEKPDSPGAPRRGPVTQADVDRAALALVLDGQRPTVDSVRQVLGGGSPNTVLPMLRVFHEGLAKRLALEEAPNSITRLATELWNKALAEAGQRADERVAGVRAEAAAAVDAALQGQARAEAATRDLQLVHQDLASRCNGAEILAGELRAELGREREAGAAAAARLEAAEARQLELQRELAAAIEVRSRDAAAALAAADEEARRHMLALDDEKTKVKALERAAASAASTAAEQLKAAQGQLAATKLELATLTATSAVEVKRLERIEDELTQRALTAEQRLAHAESTIGSRVAERNTFMQKLAGAEGQVSAYKEMLDDLRRAMGTVGAAAPAPAKEGKAAKPGTPLKPLKGAAS